MKMDFRAVFEVPASWSKAKRVAAFTGELRPIGKPDLDNVIKAWGDALEDIVFFNDSQIVHLSAQKMYGPEDVVVVTVSAL